MLAVVRCVLLVVVVGCWLLFVGCWVVACCMAALCLLLVVRSCLLFVVRDF